MEAYGLSDRELEILELLAGGASNKEIAAQLVISTNTVKVHLRNIYAKLGVNSRTEAAMFALRNKLFTVDGFGINEDMGNEPYPRKGILQSFGIESFRGQSVGWYLTIGIVVVLLIGIIGILIIVTGGGNDSGVGGPSGDELESQRWQVLTDLPTARTGLAVTTFENQIYTIGGETKKGISGYVERFDPLTNTWERLADKPIPVTDIHAVAIGGLIYVPGGRLESGETTSILEVFDPRSELWQLLAPLPTPLSAYSAVSYEGKLFIFGGWDGGKYTHSVFSYDPQTNVWMEGSAMQISRGFTEAEVAGGAIYVMGGLNEAGPLDLNEAYFPQRENSGEIPWQTRASMPEPRYAFGLTSVADILHVIGGLGGSNAIPPRKYSPHGDSWQVFLPPNLESWSHMGVASIEDFLYVLGGRHGDRISSENLSYKAIYTIALPLVQ